MKYLVTASLDICWESSVACDTIQILHDNYLPKLPCELAAGFIHNGMNIAMYCNIKTERGGGKMRVGMASWIERDLNWLNKEPFEIIRPR